MYMCVYACVYIYIYIYIYETAWECAGDAHVMQHFGRYMYVRKRTPEFRKLSGWNDDFMCVMETIHTTKFNKLFG